MSKTVVVLSLSTALLATSTAYLAYELYQRDAGQFSTGAVVSATAVTDPDSLAAHREPGATGPGTEGGVPTRTSIPAAGDAAGAAPPADSGKRSAQDDPAAGF